MTSRTYGKKGSVIFNPFLSDGNLRELASRRPLGHCFLIDMVPLSGGEFMMGSESIESQTDERPVHRVILDPFEIGKYPVTERLWGLVMNDEGPESILTNRPKDYVSWHDCQLFLKRLNLITGQMFRLPTEAEWEYAARGGTTGDRYGPLNEIATYDDGSCNAYVEVGQKKPNAYGLYDMLGLVWEWCSDNFGPYEGGEQINPKGVERKRYRVMRGGSKAGGALCCRAPDRCRANPGERASGIGLRLARDITREFVED